MKFCPACEAVVTDKDVVVCPDDQTLLQPLTDIRFPFGTRWARHYVIKERLHKSFECGVYAAIHELTEIPVVLKIGEISPDHPQFQKKHERFMRQAAMQSTLKHDNIAGVLDAGIERHSPYIILEKVGSGQSLFSIGNRLRHLPLRYFLSTITQVAGALAYVHTLSMHHNDLSPNDILFCANADGLLTVKLTDFNKGLPLLHGDNQLMQETAVGDLFGHPEFMSPEQCRGDSTHLSNMYSLGAIMHVALSETNKFVAANWAAVIMNKLHETVPACDGSLREPAANEPLIAIIRKCMAMSPSERYQSMDELTEALNMVPCEPGPVLYADIFETANI